MTDLTLSDVWDQILEEYKRQLGVEVLSPDQLKRLRRCWRTYYDKVVGKEDE